MMGWSKWLGIRHEDWFPFPTPALLLRYSLLVGFLISLYLLQCYIIWYSKIPWMLYHQNRTISIPNPKGYFFLAAQSCYHTLVIAHVCFPHWMNFLFLIYCYIFEAQPTPSFQGDLIMLFFLCFPFHFFSPNDNHMLQIPYSFFLQFLLPSCAFLVTKLTND